MPPTITHGRGGGFYTGVQLREMGVWLIAMYGGHVGGSVLLVCISRRLLSAVDTKSPRRQLVPELVLICSGVGGLV